MVFVSLSTHRRLRLTTGLPVYTEIYSAAKDGFTYILEASGSSMTLKKKMVAILYRKLQFCKKMVLHIYLRPAVLL